MITEDERNRIIEEETFRCEVKKRLEAAASDNNRLVKLWKIINSAVFIWFLSSIVVGLATFLYSQWDKSRELIRETEKQIYSIKKENERTADKLDGEITSRLIYFSNMLEIKHLAHLEFENVKIQERQKFVISQYLNLSKMITALDRPSAVDYPVNVFPVYSNRNLRSLLWELLRVVPESERASIQLAYDKSLHLQSIYLESEYSKNKYPGQGMMTAYQARALLASNRAIRDFYSSANLKRWGNPFTAQLQRDKNDKSDKEKKD